MTRNQLEFRAQNEAKRANLAKEVIQQSYNEAMVQLERDKLVQNLAIAQANLQETARSNKAREAETYRSNLAKETETKRSNLAAEQERYRSAVASLDELTRHNIRTEELSSESNAISRNRALEEARANQARERLQSQSLQYNYANLGYMYATLTELSRSNIAKETEQHRSNVANEGIRQGTLTETSRSNRVSETLQGISIRNTAEYNQGRLDLDSAKLDETKLYNREQIRLGYSKLKEERRHNINEEVVSAVKAATTFAGTIIDIVK